MFKNITKDNWLLMCGKIGIPLDSKISTIMDSEIHHESPDSNQLTCDSFFQHPVEKITADQFPTISNSAPETKSHVTELDSGIMNVIKESKKKISKKTKTKPNPTNEEIRKLRLSFYNFEK